MSNIAATSVAKIIEGALEGDLRKVKAYGKLIADNLEEDDDYLAARVIWSSIDSSYKDGLIVTLSKED